MHVDILPFLVGYIFFYKVKRGKKGLLREEEKNPKLNRVSAKELYLSIEDPVFPEITQRVKSNEDGLLGMGSAATIVMY